MANRIDSYSRLQGLIVEAIGSLECNPSDLTHGRQNELYELLYFRFVQQMPQQQVARQLGMSTRHLRRREHAAIELLAGQLWQRRREALAERRHAPIPEAELTAAELDWVRDNPIETPGDLPRAIEEILALLTPIVERYHVDLSMDVQDNLPRLSVHSVALNQLLLALLTLAIHYSEGGHVSVITAQRRGDVLITVQGRGPQPSCLSRFPEDQANLAIARRLAVLSRGTLAVETTAQGVRAELILPALGRDVVLVVDDNADTLQLVQRYVAGSRYTLATTRNPEEALSLALEYGPVIIVLDVMMPQIDGWKLLGRLREHPALRGVPILVFTIMAQEEIALALGASAFLQKPVTRRQLLEALDALLDRSERAVG